MPTALQLTEMQIKDAPPRTDSSPSRSFADEINQLGQKIKASTGSEDFRHFRKMERWGQAATWLGYATAWIIPNPISAFFLSVGNYARWSLVLHPISHKTFDQINAIPSRYKSHVFAKGHRRYRDWLDWITPDNWSDEHNHLHHFHLGTERDPDVVWRNSAFLRQSRSPYWFRYGLALFIAGIWKPVYYAANTLAESRYQRKMLATNKIGWNNWSPCTSEGRELWFKSLLPYALIRFLLLPLAFCPFGKHAVISVLLNSLCAELFTNWHSFVMIAPNHTGDDVYTFSSPAKGRDEYYIRQIVGTINYPAGTDWQDFLYGGMNYQIEHHLWPEASLLQCKRVRPLLRACCQKYGIPYREAPFISRVRKTLQMIAGGCRELEVPHAKNFTK